MMKTKRRIRNFRISEDLDRQLMAAAEVVGTTPSTLMREFVKDGSALILGDTKVQESLRRRFD